MSTDPDKEIKQLQSEIRRLTNRITNLENSERRYKRSPYDKLYMQLRKIKVKHDDVKAERDLEKRLPSISVVIATYKLNDYINTCIKSALDQRYPKNKLNIIVVVNGDDISYFDSLVYQYRNNDNVQIVYTPQKGLPAARNYARQYITTDCITYLDDDDMLTNGYLKELAQHITPEISVVCGRMVDIENDGHLNTDTYINQSLSKYTSGIRKDYLEVGSCFSNFQAKLFNSKLFLEIFDPIDESLSHTEDIVFWVENIYKLEGKIYSCDANGKEAYLHRITENSMSRPDPEREYSFYITDRLALIERFSKPLFDTERDITYKTFVVSKIDASIQHMLNYYRKSDNNIQYKARTEIFNCNSPFLNKSFFAAKKGIAFCHNFTPSVDASAYVASKRLPELNSYIGEPIAWTVVTADMSNKRKKDYTWDRFFAKYWYSNKITIWGNVYFNEEAQYKWALRAINKLEEINKDNNLDVTANPENSSDENISYIYSRSMWVGSHEAAYRYKIMHPEVQWFAEFSDPIYTDTTGNIRPSSKDYEGELAFLNTYWQDIEIKVCDTADLIIFTNDNQRTVMVNNNPGLDMDNILSKSLIWSQPQISSEYTKIVQSKLDLNEDKINIGYFGTFYPTRDYSAMLMFLNDPRIELYIFTDNPKILELTAQEHPNLHMMGMVPQLEFLNLAHRMDYCYLNDVKYPGKIDPYLPSKLADYLSADTMVIALTYPDTPMDKIDDDRIIKVRNITMEFIESLQKRIGNSTWKNRIILDSSLEQSLEHNFSLTRDMLNWKSPLSNDPDEIIQKANDIQNGLMYVCHAINVPSPYDIDSIDWDVSFSDSPGSFSLYLLALNPTAYLTQAYNLTQNADYLITAKNIIQQWLYYKNTEAAANNAYMWNDHGMAIRTNNLIYFLLAYKSESEVDNAFYDDVISALKDHGDHLSNENEYRSNHNHGIYQDEALIYLAYFLNCDQSEAWLELAKNRLMGQKEFAFNSEMVHAENSPGYQMTVSDLFYQIALFLSSQGDTFGQQLFKDIERSFEFMVWITKPNGFIEQVGDTSSKKNILNFINTEVEKYGNEHLIYAAELGKNGSMPENNSIIYPISGYYFGRNTWDSENYCQATWTMFKAGYSSRSHKHADDISFTLYSKGYDLLIDPGYYNYTRGNKYTEYLISSSAHNTVTVDEHSYSTTEEYTNNVGIYSYDLGEYFDYVLAYNNMYEGVQIDRHFLYGGDVVLIIDDISSEEEHEYQQLFHLSEYMRIESTSDNEVLCAIGESNFHLRIRQLSKNVNLDVVNGSNENAKYGMIAKVINDLQYINTLKWSASAKNITIVTLLTIEDNAGKVLVGKQNECCDSSACYYDTSRHHINFSKDTGNEISIGWTLREKPSFKHIVLSIDHDTVTVKNNLTPTDDWMYAYHLIDADTSNELEIGYFADSPISTFKIDTNGIYLIKAYLLSKHGSQKTSKVIAALNKNDKSLVNVSDQYPWLNLIYHGHMMERLENNTWKFTIDYDFSFKSRIWWFIYKNGGFYDHIAIYDSKSLEYTFTEPGSYSVMYYIKSNYGDNLYYCFNEIKVDEPFN